MAGTTTGRNSRIPHFLFVSTYLAALEAGIPIWPELRKLGMTDRDIEKRRTAMSEQGWMPYGRLTQADAPRVRAMLRAKLDETRQKLLDKERRVADAEFYHRARDERTRAWLRTRSEQRELSAQQWHLDARSGIVLDQFMAG